MIPKQYYTAPLSSFQTLQGVQWEAVQLGTGLHFGHVDFCGDNTLQTNFEAQPGVTSVGTLFHQNVPPAALAALQAHGASGTDNVMAVAEKIAKKLGGFRVHY